MSTSFGDMCVSYCDCSSLISNRTRMICKGSLGLSRWVCLNLNIMDYTAYSLCLCRLYWLLIAMCVEGQCIRSNVNVFLGLRHSNGNCTAEWLIQSKDVWLWSVVLMGISYYGDPKPLQTVCVYLCSYFSLGDLWGFCHLSWGMKNLTHCFPTISQLVM